MRVTVHIYDVTGYSLAKTMNQVLRRVGTGAFHTGVEIDGVEYSYGSSTHGTGVTVCVPKNHPCHAYRESVAMGKTVLDFAQVASAGLQATINMASSGVQAVTSGLQATIDKCACGDKATSNYKFEDFTRGVIAASTPVPRADTRLSHRSAKPPSRSSEKTSPKLLHREPRRAEALTYKSPLPKHRDLDELETIWHSSGFTRSPKASTELSPQTSPRDVLACFQFGEMMSMFMSLSPKEKKDDSKKRLVFSSIH